MEKNKKTHQIEKSWLFGYKGRWTKDLPSFDSFLNVIFVTTSFTSGTSWDDAGCQRLSPTNPQIHLVHLVKACLVGLDLRKAIMLWTKIQNIFSQMVVSLMLIYHGTIRKTSPSKQIQEIVFFFNNGGEPPL